MLRRLRKTTELSVSALAQHYSLTFGAISKHLKVLEAAQAVSKRREGKQQMVRLSPAAFRVASRYLREYAGVLAERHQRLDELLRELKE